MKAQWAWVCHLKIRCYAIPGCTSFFFLIYEHLSILHKCRSCVHWNPKQLSSVQIHRYSKCVCTYCSLAKERPWAEHLTRPSKKGVVLFWVFLHSTTKERPCHVYSDLMPSKQITRQTLTHNRTNSGFKAKAWWHNYTLNDTMSLRPLVSTTLVKSVYTKLPCNNLRWSSSTEMQERARYLSSRVTSG